MSTAPLSAQTTTKPSAPICRECGTIKAIIERKGGTRRNWTDSLGENPTVGMQRREGSSGEDNASADRAARGPATAGTPTARAGSASQTGRTGNPQERASPSYTRESAAGSSSTGTAGNYGNSDAQGDSISRKRHWDVMIAMDDGNLRVIEYDRRPGLQQGDKVKVLGKNVFVR